MTDSNPSFLGRISLAVSAFFRILGDGEFAAAVLRVRDGGAAAQTQTQAQAQPVRPRRPPRPRRRSRKPAPTPRCNCSASSNATRASSISSRKTSPAFSDADIGAAARLVHEGCRADAARALHDPPGARRGGRQPRHASRKVSTRARSV